jgi:MFS family permease
LNEARLLLLDILAKENELQRTNVQKHDFHMKEILSEITKSFTLLSNSFSFSTRYAFFLAAIMVMFFSFWDTMAITYQPIFLKQFEGTLGIFSVMVMPIFILPVFILQIPFGKLADKWGSHVMILIGLFISGLSLVLLGTLDVLWGGSITMLIISGMGNSIGYAAAFSASQVKLTQELSYYVTITKKKIENSALAATLRLALNIGNIFGQLFGGLIFSLLGFYTGFFMIGICLFLLFFISLIFIKNLAIPKVNNK